jgi:hypothetical protein
VYSNFPAAPAHSGPVPEVAHSWVAEAVPAPTNTKNAAPPITARLKALILFMGISFVNQPEMAPV